MRDPDEGFSATLAHSPHHTLYSPATGEILQRLVFSFSHPRRSNGGEEDRGSAALCRFPPLQEVQTSAKRAPATGAGELLTRQTVLEPMGDAKLHKCPFWIWRERELWAVICYLLGHPLRL